MGSTRLRRPPAPTDAERARSLALRGGAAALVGTGSAPVSPLVHHVRAEQVHGPDRERVRQAALAFHSGYAAYEERAGGRDLGFFILRPITGALPAPGHD